MLTHGRLVLAAAACSQLVHYYEILLEWWSNALALVLRNWWVPWCDRARAPDIEQEQLMDYRVCFESQRQDLCGKCCWEGVKRRENPESRVLFKGKGQFWVTPWKPAGKLYSFASFEI